MKYKTAFLMIIFIFIKKNIYPQSYDSRIFEINRYGAYILDENITLSSIYVNNTCNIYNSLYIFGDYVQFEDILFFKRTWNPNMGLLLYDFLTNETFEIDIYEVRYIKFLSKNNLIINGYYFGGIKDIEVKFPNRDTPDHIIGAQIFKLEIEDKEYYIGTWTLFNKMFTINLFDRNIILNLENINESYIINYYGYIFIRVLYNPFHRKYYILISSDPGK
jgi:hypothetical protein